MLLLLLQRGTRTRVTARPTGPGAGTASSGLSHARASRGPSPPGSECSRPTAQSSGQSCSRSRLLGEPSLGHPPGGSGWFISDPAPAQGAAGSLVGTACSLEARKALAPVDLGEETPPAWTWHHGLLLQCPRTRSTSGPPGQQAEVLVLRACLQRPGFRFWGGQGQESMFGDQCRDSGGPVSHNPDEP